MVEQTQINAKNGYPGVYFHPARKWGMQWLAMISRKSLHWAKLYRTAELAAAALNDKLKEHGLEPVKPYSHTAHKMPQGTGHRETFIIFECAVCSAEYENKVNRCVKCGSCAIKEEKRQL